MNRKDFRFFHSLRVRWAEVDMQKIVFNAHYLMYLDTAVADYWRAMALPYVEAMHQLGGDLYVKKAQLEYHGSARYDDTVDIGLKCAHIGNSSMDFAGGIFRGEQLLVGSNLVYVFADPATQTSQRVPGALREVLLGFEAGEAMTSVRVGAWSELGEDAAAVREAVFVQEQGIAKEVEWDEQDAQLLHAVTYNRLGQPVATGRLLQAAPGVAKVGRMAVARVLRGAGLGAQVLQTLEHAARERGDLELMLHSQQSAQGFYAKLGYSVRGQPFEEAGISHIEMYKTLSTSA
jgi:YbgC/YbaW family acyl-CoA thioester hydrolase